MSANGRVFIADMGTTVYATSGHVIDLGPCGSADFNHDGDHGTDQDIESFFRVLAGGAC